MDKKDIKEDTTGFGVGHFPMKLFVEWDKDCRENFGDTRWIKLWQDHILAKQSQKEEAMWKYIMDLNDKVDSLMKQPEPEKEEEEEEPDKDFVPTLGEPTPKKKKEKVNKNE